MDKVPANGYKKQLMRMKRIVIIDDDSAIQHARTIMLERDNFIVDVFAGADVIFSRNYIPPDIFLIDRRLAGVDGLDVCRHLKSDVKTQHIPVIMFSASPAVEPLAYEAGADAFIEKPFALADMRNMLKKFATTT